MSTRSTESRGRKESRGSLFPILRSMTEESPEEGNTWFQKTATSQGNDTGAGA